MRESTLQRLVQEHDVRRIQSENRVRTRLQRVEKRLHAYNGGGSRTPISLAWQAIGDNMERKAQA
jgi:hypothetical protein